MVYESSRAISLDDGGNNLLKSGVGLTEGYAPPILL